MGGMTMEQKELVLEIIESANGFQYTHHVLAGLHEQMFEQLRRVESAFGSVNPEMRVLLQALRV
jgi:hypothetical protein